MRYSSELPTGMSRAWRECDHLRPVIDIGNTAEFLEQMRRDTERERGMSRPQSPNEEGQETTQ